MAGMCSSFITASPCFLVAEELPFHGFAADAFRLGGAQLGAAADPHLTALQHPWGPQPPNTQILTPSLVLPPGTAAASLVSPALPHPHLFFPPLGLRGQLLCPPQGVTASPGAFQNLSQLAPSKPSQTQGSGETSQEGWASITTAHGLPWLKTPMAGFCHLPRSQPLPALLLLVLPAGHGAAHVGFCGWKGQRERAGAVAKGTVEVHCSPGQVISICCFSGSWTVHEHDKTVFGCLEGKPGVNSGRRLEKKGTVLNVSGYPAHPYKRPVWRAPQSTTDWGEFLQTLVSTQMLVGVRDGASSHGGQPCGAAEQRP